MPGVNQCEGHVCSEAGVTLLQGVTFTLMFMSGSPWSCLVQSLSGCVRRPCGRRSLPSWSLESKMIWVESKLTLLIVIVVFVGRGPNEEGSGLESLSYSSFIAVFYFKYQKHYLSQLGLLYRNNHRSSGLNNRHLFLTILEAKSPFIMASNGSLISSGNILGLEKNASNL